jgi:aryl-phospho-beta-D-glucosidase BglC (GH1 family)
MIMNGQLSHGLPWLTTAGNRIVNASTGAPVLLRGLNRSGLEYSDPDEQGFLSGAGICRAEVQAIVKEWGSNIVRLPFNQDFVLRGRNGLPPEQYQQALDQVIAWNAMFGAYTLLDLQWLDTQRIYGGARNFIAPFPNMESVTLWTTIAARYKEEPAVLYDLFTEPHDRLPDDPYLLNKEDGTTYPAGQFAVTMAMWQPWAQHLASVIRMQNPRSLIFVSGVDWAYDLGGMPIDVSNVVYSSHVYSNKGTDWADAFGNLAETVPVFVGEFGGADTSGDLDFVSKLLAYLQARGIGWTAWSWFNDPFLVNRYAPTKFGALVRQRLAAP